MSNQPTTDKLVDLRIAHLNMTQGIISRMSGFSAGVKNFCVTLSAAIIALAFQDQAPSLVWAGVAVVLIFFAMDAYYLALERRYRSLYEDLAKRPFEDAAELSLKPPAWEVSTIFQAVKSPSVLGFYTLLLIGIVALLTIASHDEPKRPKDTVVGSSRHAGSAKRGEPSGFAGCTGADGRQTIKAQLSESVPVGAAANTAAPNAGGSVRAP